MSTPPRARLSAVLAFLFCYVILALALRHRGARDPDSIFFDPDHAFERHYSARREAEAEVFTALALEGDAHFPRARDPEFCVGITSVRRPGASYLRHTMGSLLAGLTPVERESVLLVPLLADADATGHDAHNATWLRALADEVLTYADAPSAVLHEVQRLEAVDAGEHKQKPLFDYAYLLQHCHDSGAPYIVMLEDDVLAADGWLLRTKRALRTLADAHAAAFPARTIYLRLFYNEGLLGFNSEDWPKHLAWSASLDALLLAALLLLRHRLPATRKHLTNGVLGAACLIAAPMLIGLYFAAGRLVVDPLPRGVHRMDAYGCCSQAFVFPRDAVPGLIRYYQEAGRGMADQLTERYAEEAGLARWALTPAVFQHVGSTSSKPSNPSKYGRRNTELIWNYEFEMLRGEDLAAFHE